MPLEITVALLTLAGVVVSVVVSLMASNRQTRSQLDQVRYQTAQAFTGKLHEKRFEVYPALYAIISRFAKRIRQGGVTKDDLREFDNQLNEWDSSYALFCSALSVEDMIALRKEVTALLTLTEDSLSKRKLKPLIPLILELELALKTELGVFEAEGYHSPARAKYLREVLDTLRRNSGDYEVE